MQNSWSYIPIWVYPLFLFLLYIGIKQCYARSMKVQRLFILPAIFILMSLNNLDGSPELTWLSGPCWAAAIALGIYLGYLHKRNAKITVDRDQAIISIPGDWSMLLLLLLIFVVEFAVNAVEATGTSSSSWFGPTALAISGLVTGMSIGRNGTYLYRYFKAE
ncbi:MAG: hypothetical protein K0R66_363 [Gammaproteobacteria bacterium]|jgi:hypothetical protein|nr:hypothetical protein [Gammaproteobacteria bacterium]